jgi:hypothetical protein
VTTKSAEAGIQFCTSASTPAVRPYPEDPQAGAGTPEIPSTDTPQAQSFLLGLSGRERFPMAVTEVRGAVLRYRPTWWTCTSMPVLQALTAAEKQNCFACAWVAGCSRERPAANCKAARWLHVIWCDLSKTPKVGGSINTAWRTSGFAGWGIILGIEQKPSCRFHEVTGQAIASINQAP